MCQGKIGERDSTIDLAWVSENLRAEYGGCKDFTGSDHYPQVLFIQTAAEQPPQHEPEGYS